MNLFMGIDPGKNGGAGVLDDQGAYVDAWRWKESDPLASWYKLSIYVGKIKKVYIERVNLFRQLSVDQILRMAPMVGNSAKWEMMLAILQIHVDKLMPKSWQKKIGLDGWRRTKARFTTVQGKELLLTPYNLARHLWPDAPLRTQSDDGMAVGLLLAEVARLDVLNAGTALNQGPDPLRRPRRPLNSRTHRRPLPPFEKRHGGLLTQPLFETCMDSGPQDHDKLG